MAPQKIEVNNIPIDRLGAVIRTMIKDLLLIVEELVSIELDYERDK